MKKILFVSHGFACFMSDILFHGFKKLGYDIYEYPQGTHYYGGESVFAGRKNLGKNDFLSFCYFNFPRKEMTDDEILNQDYDCVVITSWRPEQPWILESIYKRFNGKIPIAFVDGEDDLFFRTTEFYNDIYFKRELNPDLICDKIKPITFGIIEQENNYIYPKKDYLLTFLASGHNKDSLRCQMFRNLARREDRIEMIFSDMERSSTGMMDYKVYNQLLRSSKIGISIRGEGYDTYRYYEIPYYGALLMADIPTIHIENNFIDMESAVFFKDINDFNQKLDYLKDNPDLIQRIAQKGHEHLLKFHTSKNRAEYVMKEIEAIK